MARKFNNFDKIADGDFVRWEQGIHILTITKHEESEYTNKQGITSDTDIFYVTSDTGAESKVTLYFKTSTEWTYKRLMASCGVKTEQMKGDQTVNFDKLVGRRFGCEVEIEETESWSEEKGKTVTRRYPRFNAAKFMTEEKAINQMEVQAKNIKDDVPTWQKEEDMTPVLSGEDIPF